MAAVKNSDIKEIFSFMGDFWSFVKEFWVPENNNTYWQQVFARANELEEKYQKNRFCQIMILAYEDYLEEKQIGKKVVYGRGDNIAQSK